MNDTYRINRLLAKCGLGSRRSVEGLIKSRQIKLNGEIVTDLSTQVDPKTDQIIHNGKLLSLELQKLYYRYYKPVGVISTMTDMHNERSIASEIPNLHGSVSYAGRLDKNSEGLLILTNDGELIQGLTHPTQKVAKVYLVHTNRLLTSAQMDRFMSGIKLQEGITKKCEILYLESKENFHIYQITLYQGWKRQIRRMLTNCKVRVERLIRIQLGPFNLEGIADGDMTSFTQQENDLTNILLKTNEK